MLHLFSMFGPFGIFGMFYVFGIFYIFYVFYSHTPFGGVSYALPIATSSLLVILIIAYTISDIPPLKNYLFIFKGSHI